MTTPGGRTGRQRGPASAAIDATDIRPSLNKDLRAILRQLIEPASDGAVTH